MDRYALAVFRVLSMRSLALMVPYISGDTLAVGSLQQAA